MMMEQKLWWSTKRRRWLVAWLVIEVKQNPSDDSKPKVVARRRKMKNEIFGHDPRQQREISSFTFSGVIIKSNLNEIRLKIFSSVVCFFFLTLLNRSWSWKLCLESEISLKKSSCTKLKVSQVFKMNRDLDFNFFWW